MKVDTDALRSAAEAVIKTLGLTSIQLEIAATDFNECANPRTILALLDEMDRLRAALGVMVEDAIVTTQTRDQWWCNSIHCCASGKWWVTRHEIEHRNGCLVPIAEATLRGD